MIRSRALLLLTGMITKKNLQEIVAKLMLHLQKTTDVSYRDELIEKIVTLCSQGW